MRTTPWVEFTAYFAKHSVLDGMDSHLKFFQMQGGAGASSLRVQKKIAKLTCLVLPNID